MIVGIPKEIKAEENRVAITPAGVEVMKQNGHTVLVEKSAGEASAFFDASYTQAGAEIVDSAAEIYKRADMIMHIKEPQPSEYELIREGQVLFAYFHFAASEKTTRAIMKTNAVAIAYETIKRPDGSLPLLKPMSEVCGRMAVQEGAKYLEMAQGGHGVLLGGVPGVDPATVVVIGAGVVGTNAAKMACGLGAKVYLLDIDLERLRYLSDVMPSNCILQMSSPATIRKLVKEADVVVGAVLIPGSRAPRVVSREMLKTMKQGAVLVDVAIDQGGCFETSRLTSHGDPIYETEGIVHYCIENMPGAVPMTSTIALTNATLFYAIEIANKGWIQACRENPGIKSGVNLVKGNVTYQGIADTFGLEYTPIDTFI